MKAGSKLEALLGQAVFAVTAELGPPKGPDVSVVDRKIELLRNVCDAINVTDNQTAIVRLSSGATCARLCASGVEPVMQMTARDRNRLAIQADVFGAVSQGVRNLLCLSGDHQTFGNHPQAKNVYDIDSIQMIAMIKDMRDEARTQGGDEIEGEVPMFIGGAANPFGDPFEMRVIRLAKKVAAGVDFIQTQCIYDMPRFREWMRRIVDLGLHEKVHILAGVMPLKSAGMARYVHSSVAGIRIPDAVMKRISGAGRGKSARQEGMRMCAETIQELREIEGVHGVHIMAVEWEEAIEPITEQAGLLPRPDALSTLSDPTLGDEGESDG